MKQIISASRRTDMPGNHLDLLAGYLAQGFSDVKNPFYGKLTRVDLRPESVHTLVLWSKNFGPFLRNDRYFRDYQLYFLFTINDMPFLETSILPLQERLEQAEELARRYGGIRIGWRFDPVVFGKNGPLTTIDSFAEIGQKLASFGIKRAIFSFLDIYGKVRARNEKFGLGIIESSSSEKLAYAARLSETAAQLGLEPEHCSESLDDTVFNSRGCINGELLSSLSGEQAPAGKDRGQRKNCRCTVSRDIGSYKEMPCSHGCLYCYANPLINDKCSGAVEK